MRLNIFIRTMGLLVMLVGSITLCMVMFLVWQNREQWDEYCLGEALFMAERAERMVLWDDRVALRDMLDKRMTGRNTFSYAFVESGGQTYVKTMAGGVPMRLMGGGDIEDGQAFRRQFIDDSGRVFYDFVAGAGENNTLLHLGIWRDGIDRRIHGLVKLVCLTGALLLALVAIPAWHSAGRITTEVERMTGELTRLNEELEARVLERTAELRETNEALEREIAERIKLERQKEDFYAMVTHDLKTPISVISGYVELLKEQRGSLGDDRAEMVDAIDRSARRLNSLVADFLMSARLEAGRSSLNLGTVEPAALADEVKTELSGLARERGVELDLSAEAGLPQAAWDDAYVNRALANLVRNAISFSRDGGKVAMGVRVREEVGGAHVELSVTDDGPGIPPEEHGKVFEKYYRSRKSAGSKGSGLGLYIVKGVCQAHGGRVELESEPGRGSIFRMVLPVECAG